jgi:hypothetical protein
MFLCCKPECLPDCSDWIIFGLGVIVTIGWALFILWLRPKIEINEPRITEHKGKDVKVRKSIQIPIKNNSKISKATRILIEVALICDKKTYHFKTDFQDFAFIPENSKKNDPVRVFNAFDSADFLKKFWEIDIEDLFDILENQDSILRVRTHATHSFSGLGRTNETCFSITKNGVFTKIKCSK